MPNLTRDVPGGTVPDPGSNNSEAQQSAQSTQSRRKKSESKFYLFFPFKGNTIHVTAIFVNVNMIEFYVLYSAMCLKNTI